ncbi:MAG: hypothetical protein ABEJ87_03530 [Candidatus Nanohalobium sp.]
MADTTRFEEAFIDHPVLRDITLFLFLTFGFGIPFKILFETAIGKTVLSFLQALMVGLAFAVLWITAMELYARYRNTSILRSIGEDPLEE